MVYCGHLHPLHGGGHAHARRGADITLTHWSIPAAINKFRHLQQYQWHVFQRKTASFYTFMPGNKQACRCRLLPRVTYSVDGPRETQMLPPVQLHDLSTVQGCKRTMAMCLRVATGSTSARASPSDHCIHLSSLKISTSFVCFFCGSQPPLA